MIVRWVTLLLSLLWLTPVLAEEPRIILIHGDSLSAGYGMPLSSAWPTLLSKQVPPGYRVINSSQSGETTTGGLNRLPDLLTRHRPSIVVLELGANDALRGLPLDQARNNLARMITLSRQAKARVLLVGMRLPPNFGPAYTAKFSALYTELAKTQNVALLPFLLEGFADDLSLFQPDQIHPTAAAQPRVMTTVQRALQPLLKP